MPRGYPKRHSAAQDAPGDGGRVTIAVRLPGPLLARLDEQADAVGDTRTSILIDALVAQLGSAGVWEYEPEQLAARDAQRRKIMALTDNQRRQTVPMEHAAALLGISTTTAYKYANLGEFPCMIIKIGGRWVVPKIGLAKLLGLDPSQLDQPPGAATADAEADDAEALANVG